MEGVVINTMAYDKGCIGCKRFERDIMVSMHTDIDGKKDFNDFFLTTEQAEYLRDKLTAALNRNTQED